MASALVTFAREVGASVIAVGIETEAELGVIRELGVPLGQGYYFGRPDAPESSGNRTGWDRPSDRLEPFRPFHEP